MSSAPFGFYPAIRTVDANGNVVLPVVPLSVMSGATYGIFMDACDPPSYAPEYQAEWLNASYSLRKRLLGYRVSIRVSFILAEVNGNISTWGVSLLRAYWEAGTRSDTFAALQFTLYVNNVAGAPGAPRPATPSPWRGMWPSSNWDPRLVNGKENRGFSWTLEATSADLITAPGDFAQSTW